MAAVPDPRNITNLSDARALLLELGASDRLVRHAELVSEAAEALLALFAVHHIALDAPWVRAGAALHDVGKLEHRDELDRPGALHEPAGELLLLAHHVAPHIARCCRSHAQWSTLECSLEELVVALADKLWKGARVPVLEQRVIDATAARGQRDLWALYVPLDAGFEAIADGASGRLARSR